MKQLLLLLAIPICAMGQADNLTPACPTTPPFAGQPTSVSINMSGQAVSGAQFNLALPANAANVSVAAGASAVAAGKQVSFLPTGTTVLITGVNTNLMQPGPIAIVTFTIPTSGQYTAGIATNPAPIGAIIDASQVSPVSTAVNPPCAVSVSPAPNKCDVNADGVVNQIDVGLVISWTLGAPIPSGQLCDKDGNGTCNVLDVGMIIKAALGGACSAVQ